MGRDHACENCGRGGFNDPDGVCDCQPQEGGEDRWPLTLVRRGERVGSYLGSYRPDYVWWHELPEDTTAESARSVGYEVVTVVPASASPKALPPSDIEAERDLWRARYERLMGWVVWFRDNICGFIERPAARRSWQGLNRDIGREDLFMASLEIQREVEQPDVAAGHARDKDKLLRALLKQAGDMATASGKPQGEGAPDA